MKKKLLISLISEQAAPNLLMIKELERLAEGQESFKIDEYLFISTEKMESKNKSQLIINASKINVQQENIWIVDEYSVDDITSQIEEKLHTNEYSDIYVNITGGTKMMSIALYTYLQQNKKVKFYYLTGRDNTYFDLKDSSNIMKIEYKFKLEEYLLAYNIKMKRSKNSGVSKEYTKELFEITSRDKTFYSRNEEIFKVLRKVRGSRKKDCLISDYRGLKKFLDEIKFEHIIKKERKKYLQYNHVKYLTGDWFEEYIYNRICEEVKISNDYIGQGIICKKNDTENEFDILFIYNNELYYIECKTAVEKGLIKETIIKSNSLKKDFGLKVNSSIIVGQDIINIVNEKNNQKKFKSEIERAKEWSINLIDSEKLKSCQLVENLGIKIC